MQNSVRPTFWMSVGEGFMSDVLEALRVTLVGAYRSICKSFCCCFGSWGEIGWLVGRLQDGCKGAYVCYFRILPSADTLNSHRAWLVCNGCFRRVLDFLPMARTARNIEVENASKSWLVAGLFVLLLIGHSLTATTSMTLATSRSTRYQSTVECCSTLRYDTSRQCYLGYGA